MDSTAISYIGSAYFDLGLTNGKNAILEIVPREDSIGRSADISISLKRDCCGGSAYIDMEVNLADYEVRVTMRDFPAKERECESEVKPNDDALITWEEIMASFVAG